MTRAQLTRIIRGWQKRLRLEDWNIEIDFENDPGPGVDASVWKHDVYSDANIRFVDGWRNWSRKHANYIAVHELLHINARCRDVAARLAREELVSATAAEAYSKWYWNAEETQLDRIAEVLVELGGEL